MQSRLSLIALFVAGAAGSSSFRRNQDGNSRMSVTVTFGGGMNTATPPGVPSPPANHHVLPNLIEIKAGGVGELRRRRLPPDRGVPTRSRRSSDIVLPLFPNPNPPPSNLFMNYSLATAYYVGINPRNANTGYARSRVPR